MGFLAQVQISCFFFSYLVSFLCELFQILRTRTSTTRLILIVFTSAGLIAHTAYLLTRSQIAGVPPLMSSGQDWLLVLAWLGSVLYLILLTTHGNLAHGLFMLPAILLLVCVAVFVSDTATSNMQEITVRRWGMLHAAALVIGMAAVVGSTLSAIMFLLSHQRLRGRSQWLPRLQLPSLENLTAVNRWMVIVSVPFLTVGMLTGFILIPLSPTSATKEIRWTDPTIITSIAVWFAMVGLLIRILVSRSRSGKVVAQLSILSGGFLLITILGPMLLAEFGALETFHGGRQQTDQQQQGAQP